MFIELVKYDEPKELQNTKTTPINLKHLLRFFPFHEALTINQIKIFCGNFNLFIIFSINNANQGLKLLEVTVAWTNLGA